ncbi:DUF4188 domain-containing protein [Rhodococcus fascians]|nr:DUF4188 domain-containing protein [Rhodococcus fascians]MBY4058438.1 DUF4188 domain-containing protein [Rhodococcus fascians]MBY4067290.1 DUF4188 domain-containing protein [Rhodococcus fascians]
MQPIIDGRTTVESDRDTVTVFLIGMRINNPLAVRSWLPAARAMPRMLSHLEQDPTSGLLGYHSWLGRTTMLVSYWRNAEDLTRFASDPDAPHAPAWRAFNRSVAATGHVGVWHETYTATAQDSEAIYVNMPTFGLAGAIGGIPVGTASHTWKQRMKSAK